MHFMVNMEKMDLFKAILESIKNSLYTFRSFSSSLAMDKELSRIIFKKNKMRVPKYFLLKKDDKNNFKKKMKAKKLNFPIVIKPFNEGSSLGVYICKNRLTI